MSWSWIVSCSCITTAVFIMVTAEIGNTSPNTLVVVDGPASYYSSFTNGLASSLHHNITISRNTEELVVYGERMFDNLVIFGPNDDLFTVGKLIEFVELGGNILSASGNPGRFLRKLSNKCGFDFDKSGVSRILQ